MPFNFEYRASPFALGMLSAIGGYGQGLQKMSGQVTQLAQQRMSDNAAMARQMSGQTFGMLSNLALGQIDQSNRVQLANLSHDHAMAYMKQQFGQSGELAVNKAFLENYGIPYTGPGSLTEQYATYAKQAPFGPPVDFNTYRDQFIQQRQQQAFEQSMQAKGFVHATPPWVDQDVSKWMNEREQVLQDAQQFGPVSPEYQAIIDGYDKKIADAQRPQWIPASVMGKFQKPQPTQVPGTNGVYEYNGKLYNFAPKGAAAKPEKPNLLQMAAATQGIAPAGAPGSPLNQFGQMMNGRQQPMTPAQLANQMLVQENPDGTTTVVQPSGDKIDVKPAKHDGSDEKLVSLRMKAYADAARALKNDVTGDAPTHEAISKMAEDQMRYAMGGQQRPAQDAGPSNEEVMTARSLARIAGPVGEKYRRLLAKYNIPLE